MFLLGAVLFCLSPLLSSGIGSASISKFSPPIVVYDLSLRRLPPFSPFPYHQPSFSIPTTPQPEDGAYVFGTIVEGTQVIDKIMSMVRPKQPHFKPLSDIKIERSELTAANLPGRKEKMINRAEEEDDVKRALLQRLDGKAAVATEED